MHTSKARKRRKERVNNSMTDKQMHFLAWLITTITDNCGSIEEVKAMNAEIRRHSAGMIAGEPKQK